jgi:hypothetical protein
MTEYIIRVKTCDDGTKETRNEYNRFHSFDDAPAIDIQSGSKLWYRDGKRHRDNNEPAVIYADGTKEWYKDGQLHRDNDEPAIINPDGSKYWHKNGKQYWPTPKVETYNGKVVEIDGKKYKLTEA